MMLRNAITVGFLERTGHYARGISRRRGGERLYLHGDSRRVHFLDWPEPIIPTDLDNDDEGEDDT